MPIPQDYAWLNTVGTLPRMVQEAVKLLGVQEVVGKGSNKTIISWRDELNLAGVPIVGFSDDDIAWCGLFLAIVAHRAGKTVVDGPLWARNWAKFGTKSPKPSLGDVLVYSRKGGGHVDIYIAESPTYYWGIGGNKTNQVIISGIRKDRCIAVRRPAYNNMPASVKPYYRSGTGTVTTNEH